MTIPIVPGPFSFLGEAGEALGSIGDVIEERKRHAQQIAEHGSNFVLSQILQGADPKMLDNPDVQKMMKAAYGFTFPSSVAGAIGAEARRTGARATADITQKVPEREATAAGTAADVSAATGQAKIKSGVPQLEAEAQAALAQAQTEGANLNKNIYTGARVLLGQDPKFARLAYEAATGALDAKLRQLELYRANLSIERQQMIDNARILHDAVVEGGRRYDNAVKAWEQGQRQFLLEKGDSPDARAAYNEANPPPDPNKITEDYVKTTFGFGLPEFQSRLKQAMSSIMGQGGEVPKGNAGEGAPAPAPKSGAPTQTTSPRVQTIITNALGMKADEAGESMADAVANNEITDLEASAIIAKLRDTAPGGWYKNFNRAYMAKKSQAGNRAGTSLVP